MPKKILFIINPVSGIGKQRSVERLIDSCIDKQKFETEISYTQGPKHATEIAKEAIQKNTSIVVAVGGDGSVNEVGAALVNTGTALGIIPAGSGNGLARHLNIPLTIEKAITLINNGETIIIDTMEINGFFCAGISGIGLDAHIGWKFSQFGKRGFSSYVKVFIREFFSYVKNNYQLDIDGVKYNREAILISLANSSQYGNNAHISPLADVTDGFMDISILKPFPQLFTPYLIYQLFKKHIHKSRYMEIIKGKNITILQPSELAHIDGEPVRLGKIINAKVNPLSLKVIVPSKIRPYVKA